VLEDSYSRTFERSAAQFPDMHQASPLVVAYVTHKTFKNPLGKSLEVHSTAFLREHLGPVGVHPVYFWVSEFNHPNSLPLNDSLSFLVASSSTVRVFGSMTTP